jgi:hypothetical protein
VSAAARQPQRIPWRRIVSVAFMLAGLAFCVVTLHEAGIAQYRNLLRPALIGGLALATAAVLVASTLAWREYFRAVSACRLTFAEAFYQLGIVLIGKYVPIILGGVLARVGANASRTSASNVIGATILEQCGGLASGAAVAAVFLATWASPAAGVAVALAAVAAAAIAPYVAGPAIALMHWLRARIRRTDDFHVASIGRAPVRIAWLAQLSAWAALSVFIALIVRGLRPDMASSQIVFLIGAYLFSVMLGVAAFVFPGGIGAREAAFVWIAGRLVGYDTALVIATALRVAMTGIDLAAGAGCLLLGVVRVPAKSGSATRRV